VIFFIVGGTVWGRFYLLSLGFFAGALLTAVYLAWSGLIFGLIMSVGIFTLSLHLIRMRHEVMPLAKPPTRKMQ
jgi:hypothetical protein